MLLRLLLIVAHLTTVVATTVTYSGANGASDYIVNGVNDPDLTFQVGDTVTFSKTFAGHPLQIDSDSDGTTLLGPWAAAGDSYTHTFATAGTYTYYCTAHRQSMRGTITIVAAPSPSPPPSASPSPPPSASPSPPTPLADVICIDATVGVSLASGEVVPLGELTEGAELLTARGGVTTVRKIVAQHSDDPPYVVRAGVCGAEADTIVSPAHALRCDGKWTTAREVGARLDTNRLVNYVNVQTDDYCSDELVLKTGLVVETWDGRWRDEWRPHSYEDGERVNCQS